MAMNLKIYDDDRGRFHDAAFSTDSCAPSFWARAVQEAETVAQQEERRIDSMFEGAGVLPLDSAIGMCGRLEPILRKCGAHCALTGSTLYGLGTMKKDTDILIYPHQTKDGYSWKKIMAAFKKESFPLSEVYVTDPKYSDKTVSICKLELNDGSFYRIDFILLGAR